MPAKHADPHILVLPARKMAVVTTIGDPAVVGPEVMPALYGAVYTLKFARKKAGGGAFTVEPLRARWPDAHRKPKTAWTGIWALPIPDDVEALPQKVPGVDVRVETWTYGTVAQLLHLGPFSAEGPTVARLHAFIEAQGYVITGPHEEEYLTRPDAKAQKTIIRYQVGTR
ncbi:MAG TPA: GyrI-like domain-containing protein [Armatimonadota bacterium]|nr:GyrI-like domain-containing protein [Armatimonadota bacterium]